MLVCLSKLKCSSVTVPDDSWKLTSYYSLCLGKPQHSVRCMSVIGEKFIWCGYRNKVHVINTSNLALHVCELLFRCVTCLDFNCTV